MTADFLREFQHVLDAAPLPEVIAGAYQLESCLSQDPQGSTWLVGGR